MAKNYKPQFKWGTVLAQLDQHKEFLQVTLESVVNLGQGKNARQDAVIRRFAYSVRESLTDLALARNTITDNLNLLVDSDYMFTNKNKE